MLTLSDLKTMLQNLGRTPSGGVLMGSGTSGTPYTMTGTSKSAVSLYVTTADTADSNRTLYARLYLSGTGGGGGGSTTPRRAGSETTGTGGSAGAGARSTRESSRRSIHDSFCS